MYEGNIADLEKALYDKTKAAEAAINSAENREWRITVKRMLEHDIEENSRLSNKLNKAMELVSTLEVIIWWTYGGGGAPFSVQGPTFSRIHAEVFLGGILAKSYILTPPWKIRTPTFPTDQNRLDFMRFLRRKVFLAKSYIGTPLAYNPSSINGESWIIILVC